jgi:hypothetical protein
VVVSGAPARAAGCCRHSLLDEARILLVHGVLHLTGMDHERGEDEAAEMAGAEAQLMAAMGWRGAGLIEAAGEPAALRARGGLCVGVWTVVPGRCGWCAAHCLSGAVVLV